MQKQLRPSKEQYYLGIAKSVAERSTCMSAHFGAIIVRDDQIVSTGYSGSPRKTLDCYERGNCLRRELGIPSGERYELCRSVHAEQNVIINAARAGVSILGGDMYLWGIKVYNDENKLLKSLPCFICKKMLINSGLKRFISHDEKGDLQIYNVEDWAKGWATNDMIDDVQKYDAGNYKK